MNEKGEPVLLIVLEMQRDEDPDKKYSWPVYVTVVRAKKRCQAIVLVVALVMERQTEGKAVFPPFAQQLIDRGKHEGRTEEAARAVLTVLRARGITVPGAVPDASGTRSVSVSTARSRPRRPWGTSASQRVRSPGRER